MRTVPARGYALVLVGRTASKLDDAAQAIRSATPDAQAQPAPLDMRDPDAIKGLVEAVLSKHGRIDAVCNVAGDAPLNPIEDNTPEAWRRCVDTNLTAVVEITSRVFPAMKRQGEGVIVNVSSMASIDPFPGFSMYAATKAAVNTFTRCTADEGKDHGIRAVSIAPGAVETPMLRSLFPESQLPRDKTLDPAEVAAVIVDCVTGDRALTNGETLPLPSP